MTIKTQTEAVRSESEKSAYRPERLVKLREVLHITGLSRSRLYVLVKEGKFPAPIAIGEGSRARGWVGSRIDEWVMRAIAASSLLAMSRSDAVQRGIGN